MLSDANQHLRQNYLRQNIVFSYSEMIRVSFSLLLYFLFYFTLLLIFTKIILLYYYYYYYYYYFIIFFHENYFYFFMFGDVPGFSGMFRHVPECSEFRILSTPNKMTVLFTRVFIIPIQLKMQKLALDKQGTKILPILRFGKPFPKVCFLI